MATYNGHQEDASGNLLLPTPHSLADKVELGSTASQAYTEGTFLVFNNRLCRATKAIASGNTLAVGTNLETTSVGAQISDIRDWVTRKYKYVSGATAHQFPIIWADDMFSVILGNASSTILIDVVRANVTSSISTSGYTVTYLRGSYSSSPCLRVDGAATDGATHVNRVRFKVHQGNSASFACWGYVFGGTAMWDTM